MGFLDFLKGNWPELLALTREHIFLVGISTGLAILIGVPLGILITRVKALRPPVLGFANVMQTVPSLALFGLLIPVPFIGGIGARTAVIALALYALLPVIRNTILGVLNIDPKITEAADTMGATSWQRLRDIELPLAMPVILTGIRVAVVISVGVATVAAAIGAGGLGMYIFRGLRQNDNNLIVAGAAASAILALVCDLFIGQIERSYDVSKQVSVTRRRVTIGSGLVVLFIVVAGGHTSSFRTTVAPDQARTIVVGSKDFTESVILAEILAQLLESEGVTVTRKHELGGNIAHDGLLAGEIDVYPEYTGTAFTAILKHQPITDPQAVYDQTRREYASNFNLTVGPPLGFSNDFAILVRGSVAREKNLKTISDAVPSSRDWQAGFGQDFMSRADGYPGFVRAYGFRFNKQPREMDLALTYRALQAGEVDIIAGNSTDGLISALDLFQLSDDKQYFPPYQAVFIARSQTDVLIAPTLEKLKSAISTEAMRKMNYDVDGLKRTPRDVAAEFVASINKKGGTTPAQ